MKVLSISLHFLDFLFHGQKQGKSEWPPSPYRLYQAMLASAAKNFIEDPSIFKWLELLEPPKILAPTVIAGQPTISYVPNNHSDIAPNGVVDKIDKLVSPVVMQRDNTTVQYFWLIDSLDEHKALKVIEYAKILTVVGWGIDSVIGNGNILSVEDAEICKRKYADIWKPVKESGNLIRTPKVGTYIDLKAAFKTSMDSIKGTTRTPPIKPQVFQEVGYVKDSYTYRNTACFKLIQQNVDVNRMLSFDARNTVSVSSWCRGSLCENAKRLNNFPGNSEIYVAGHKKDSGGKFIDRFFYIPLPSIGHERTDGLIRRVIIAEPYGDTGEKAAWARRVLGNTCLFDKGGVFKAKLSLINPEYDSVFEIYTMAAERFQTVTPVVLPGRDSSNYKKAYKLFLKTLDYAGFSRKDIKTFSLQKSPFFQKGFRAPDYKKVKSFKNFSMWHVDITWKHPVYGPLVLGAGRHRGLGLFAPYK